MSSWMETLGEKGAAEVRNAREITGTAAPQPQGLGVHFQGTQHPQPPAKPSRFPSARIRPFTMYHHGKPLARPSEVIQTHFVAMLECTNQELF